MSNSNYLLQFLSSEDVSNTLLYWINCFPFQSCQEAKKLTDLRDAVALSEILVNIDENYFKDLKLSKVFDKNLWLVHLVQLKKLFLKLSAYVELYLKQDWSLLPVPDFKSAAKSDEITSHLNFMVAAVLLTATHSGKNLEYEKILELVIPTGLRKEIQLIQDAFLTALEPKSPKTFHNSPRRTALNVNTSNITPRALFPANLSTESSNLSKETSESITTFTIEKTIEEFQEFDIKLQEIHDNPSEKFEEEQFQIFQIASTEVIETQSEAQIIYNHLPSSSHCASFDSSPFFNSHSDFINLQNEIKLLEIKLSEMDKSLQKSKESENLHVEAIQNLAETRLRLTETLQELRELKEKQEYEKIERNSFLAAFDQEKQLLYDQLEILKKEKDENLIKIEELSNVNKSLNYAINQKDEQIQFLQTFHFEKFVEENEILGNELNQSKVDNSKLVKALKKARDHIINQDSLIKELKSTLQTSESRMSELSTSKDEELQFLKESFATERIALNRVLSELGTKIQTSNL